MKVENQEKERSRDPVARSDIVKKVEISPRVVGKRFVFC